MPKLIYLTDVRLSFPNLIEPQKQKNEQTGVERVAWNAEFIMPPDHPGFAEVMRDYAECAVAEWKEHANTVMQIINSDRKLRCYGWGQEKINKKTFKPFDGYEGMVFLSTSNKHQPQMIDANGAPIDPANTMAWQAQARRMYGGSRVNAAVRIWLQENKHGRGVRCDLHAIQFLRDDKAFGEGHVDVTGVFGAVAAAPSPFAPAAAMPGMPFPAAGVPQAGFAPPAAQAAPFAAPAAMPAAPFPGAPTAPPAGLPPFMGGR